MFPCEVVGEFIWEKPHNQVAAVSSANVLGVSFTSCSTAIGNMEQYTGKVLVQNLNVQYMTAV